MPEAPHEKVFKYVLDRRLAAGGMGEVFLAREDGTGKVCVIKRMLPNLMSDTQFVTMFLDEAKLAAQLNHPNIAPLYDFGMSDGVLYLAMEYVEGANLRTLVKDHAARRAQIAFEPAARIVSQAALALDYSHTATTVDGKPLRLVHRDVSPQNILLGTNGVVKLIDFGVAKAATASQTTAAGLIKGKYAYMSPEQVRGLPLDGRSDIFGLGLVLYELLANERAVPGRTDAEVAQNALHMRFAPIRQKRPDVPERLEAIVNRALQKEPGQRYQRAAEMSSELERFLADRRSSPTGAELAKLLPMAAVAAPIPSAPQPVVPRPAPPRSTAPPVPGADKRWPPTMTTPAAFWENQKGNPQTDVSTEDGLPPTQQLTPSQLPLHERQSTDASAAPTQHIDHLKLPPPPPSSDAFEPRPSPTSESATRNESGPQVPPPPAIMSESAIQRAVRRGMIPWIVSGVVLVLGAIALVAGFLLLNRTGPALPPPEPLAVKPSEPAPTPAPKPVEPPPAPPKVEPVDSALVQVVASVAAKVSVDAAPSGNAPVEVSLAPGAHTLVFQDVATGLQHKRVINVAAGDHRREVWSPEHGKLVVRASPWAEIFIGDHSFGVTPMDAPIDLVAGRHNFRFVNSDTKRTVQRVVDVPANKETLVKVDLR